MKRATMFALALTVVSGMFYRDVAQAQEKKKDAKAMPSQEEMMKKWEESMTPGEHHKLL